MNYEDLLRAGAVLAAMVALFSDSLSGAWSRFVASKKQPRPTPDAPEADAPETESLADMRTILELAARLKAQGCDEGVALCQQLLDVMLGNTHEHPHPSAPAPAKAKKQ